MPAKPDPWSIPTVSEIEGVPPEAVAMVGEPPRIEYGTYLSPTGIRCWAKIHMKVLPKSFVVLKTS